MHRIRMEYKQANKSTIIIAFDSGQIHQVLVVNHPNLVDPVKVDGKIKTEKKCDVTYIGFNMKSKM